MTIKNELSFKLYISLIVLFLLSGCDNLFENGEREGVVKYDDCREKIFIKETDLETLTKPFTCDYIKTQNGLIMRGLCIHIDYDNSGRCRKALIYTRSQQNVCDAEHPILTFDDKCKARN